METQRFKQLKLRTFLFIIVFLMLGNLPLFSQVDFSKADSIAANFSKSVDDVEDLAFQLTTSLETDIEKARVFYMWLANNVRYDCKKFHKRENPEFTAHSKEAAAKKYAVWKKEQIEKTIKRKKGICEDYSQTFKALCDAVKIEAEVVSGDSRNFHRPYKNKQNNSHAWNAVKIDDQWYLLDATWAAGYTDAAVKKFKRKISTGYFLSPPSSFILNHFPDDEKWQLLDQPILKKEFSKQPLINYGDDTFKIKAFATSVLIEKGKDSKKEIWLEFETLPKTIGVATKKGKRIKFTRTDKDGKVLLSFSNSVPPNIVIYGGTSLRSKMDWLAMYKMK